MVKPIWVLIVWLSQCFPGQPNGLVVVKHFDTKEQCQALQGKLALAWNEHSDCTQDTAQ